MTTRLFLPVLLALAQVSAAQDRGSLSAAASIRSSCGLHEDAGVLWGLGPHYKVRFDAGGIEFTPALGAEVPQNMPLRLEIEAVGRRAAGAPAQWRVVGAARRALAGLSVHYDRPGLRETYEVRPDGVEQSFVFDELPEGRGDLVVRLRMATELVASVDPASPGGLSFDVGAFGGVRVGAVTGIDANGARTQGSMRVDGRFLELVLPEVFVADAALPLVLDPLIGANLVVSSAGDEERADIAVQSTFAPSTYLVVWQRRFSGTNVDIRGQRVNEAGAPLGGQIGIRTVSTASSVLPRAGFVGPRGQYAVVWQETIGGATSIVARAVDVDTGALSAPVQVVGGGDYFMTPVISSDRELGDTLIMVWRNLTQRRLEIARLQVSSSGSLSVLGRSILASANNPALPSISGSSSVWGRYLIAWDAAASGQNWIEAKIVDRFTNFVDAFRVTEPDATLETDCDVDGDGQHWVVAYERRASGSSKTDIAGRWVTFDDATGDAYLGPAEVILAGHASKNEVNPAVGFLFPSVLVTYAKERTATNYDGMVTSIDWFSCVPCEGTLAIDLSNTRDTRELSLVGGWRDAMIVFESRTTSNNDGDVYVRRYEDQMGYTNSSYQPCPRGFVYGKCAMPGRSGYTVRLEHAEPNRPALLLLGLAHDRISLSCGSCDLSVNPFSAIVVQAPFGTDSHGNASISFRLPTAFPPFDCQWLVLPSGGATCAAFGVDFSDYMTVSPR